MENSTKDNKPEKENDLYQNLKIFTQSNKVDDIIDPKQIPSLHSTFCFNIYLTLR